ncbi:Zinc finger, CCHC-type [Sesbania bispinosa]|nr:Zinc finger, CCHC-type [Sesbania bispinosa]
MPPRTRIPARKEASGEPASQPHDPLQRGRGRGRSRGRRGVNAGRHGSAAGVANAEVPRARRGNPGMVEITTGLQGLQQVVQQLVGVVAEQQQGNQQQNLDGQQGVRQVDQQPGAMTGGIEVILAEFMKLKPPTFSGSNANEDPQRFIDGLERLWRALGCSDIRAVELTSFQLEGVAYDWFDTVTRGRSVGSPPLAWGEFSRLFMARFLPESVRDGLAHEFERLEQTEEEMRVKRFIRGLREYIFRSMVGSNCSTFAEVLSLALQLEQQQKEKGNSGRDSRKKQRVEGSQSSHPSVGVGSVPGYQVQQRAVSQRGGSSGQSFGTAQSRRSDQGRFSRTNFSQRHFGVTSAPCPTCGRHHTGVCFGDSRVCYQCGQPGHIRRDCPVAVTHPSSSHASAPAALASSQAPSAPVRQLGDSFGRGSGVAQQRGRGSGGRGQAQAGRGQARVFAMTRQDAQASNTVVTGILCICSRDAHVLFDPGATHSFVSLSFATQLGKSPSSLDETLAVTTPVGEILLAVILGMDWLASHYATLDCHNKVVTFEMPGESAFSFQGEQGCAPHNLLSALGASKLLRKGCQGYLALVRDTQAAKPCPLNRGEKAFSQRISGTY